MWQQVKVLLEPDHCDQLEQELLERGALAITYTDAADQPLFQTEPGSNPLWQSTCMLCLFDASTNMQPLLEFLRQRGEVRNSASLKVEVLEDQVWETAWMDQYHARQFGERLWICPSWQDPPQPDAVNIRMDPGLAFGSGSHQTTTLCLCWLDQCKLEGASVIDYGCGSGVLAIAAALLGADRVAAVDHDPQAIIATIENSERNGLGSDRISTYLPQALPPQQVDLLLANILAEPLLELSSTLAGLVAPGGQIVLSGMLSDQLPALARCYDNWFELDEPALLDEWALLSGTRRT